LAGGAGEPTLVGMTTRTQMYGGLLALLAGFLTAGLMPGAAEANFALPPFTATEDGKSTFANATVDPGGATHLVWSHSTGGIQTRTRTPDGALGPVQTIASSGSQPQLAADAAGNVHFAWYELNGTKLSVRARRLNADGTLSPTMDLSEPGLDAVDVRVAVDPEGRATFVWTQAQATGVVVQSRRMSPDGTLGPAKNISGTAVASPRVAVDDSGNAVIAWTHYDGTWWTAQVRRWAADGSLGPLKDVTTPGAHAAGPQVALDGAGTAHIAVTRGPVVLTRRLGPDSVLGPVVDVREQPEDDAAYPSLAVNEAGQAQVVWAAILADGARTIQTRREHADGSYGPVQDLGPWAVGSEPPMPRVALDAAGTAHHVWMLDDGSTTVMGRMVSSDGALGELQQLSGTSSPFEGGRSLGLELGVGPGGGPVAVWSEANADFSARFVQGAVVAAPNGGPLGGGGSTTGTEASPDRVAPALSRLALNPAKLVARRRGRVTYTLSERASVVLRVVRRGTGRKLGSIRVSGRAGRNSLTFRGRLRGRWLSPSRYVFVAVATDAAGNRSAPRRARFRVVRRAR
jgi:hypothetical protein